MQADRITATQTKLTEIQNARDCLQVMIIEFGNVPIETLGQLFRLTSTAELEYSRICANRLRK
jgi:hypothetical protein